MTQHETEIAADEKVPTIEIVREFDAAREQVFRAHVDPELYGPEITFRGLCSSCAASTVSAT